MNTPDLLRHLADVLTALQPARWYIQNPDKRRDFFAASTRLAESLGLHEGAALVDIAPHVRAHADALARPDVGLPEGWTVNGPGADWTNYVHYWACGPDLMDAGIWRNRHDGRIVVSGALAPPAVYLHLLRAAGVAS